MMFRRWACVLCSGPVISGLLLKSVIIDIPENTNQESASQELANFEVIDTATKLVSGFNGDIFNSAIVNSENECVEFVAIQPAVGVAVSVDEDISQHQCGVCLQELESKNSMQTKCCKQYICTDCMHGWIEQQMRQYNRDPECPYCKVFIISNFYF